MFPPHPLAVHMCQCVTTHQVLFYPDANMHSYLDNNMYVTNEDFMSSRQQI